RKLVSPSYLAVIELAPSINIVVGSVATPELTLAMPSNVVPLKNSTVPVGVPAPGLTGAIAAVIVTVWPRPDGLGEMFVVVVVVSARLTVTVAGAEVLPAKFVSPAY